MSMLDVMPVRNVPVKPTCRNFTPVRTDRGAHLLSAAAHCLDLLMSAPRTHSYDSRVDPVAVCQISRLCEMIRHTSLDQPRPCYDVIRVAVLPSSASLCQRGVPQVCAYVSCALCQWIDRSCRSDSERYVANRACLWPRPFIHRAIRGVMGHMQHFFPNAKPVQQELCHIFHNNFKNGVDSFVRVGSIYRHNEGGAPLAVAECALKARLVVRLHVNDGIRDCGETVLVGGLAGIVCGSLAFAFGSGLEGWAGV